MNVKQAINSLQEMVDSGVITGEEQFGAFTNMGETFLPIERFHIFYDREPGAAPVVHPIFLIDFI